LDWSYDLLSDAERIVFRRIAPFVGHFTLSTARVCHGRTREVPGEIFDAIAGLVEKSLIAARIDDTEAQYRLFGHDRAYALEKLRSMASSNPISLGHAEYVIQQLGSQKVCFGSSKSCAIPGNSAKFGRTGMELSIDVFIGKPPDVVHLLAGDLLHLLSEAVSPNHGSVDKYLGDGLMAFFGPPLTSLRDATERGLCALVIVKSLECWNRSTPAATRVAVRIAGWHSLRGGRAGKYWQRKTARTHLGRRHREYREPR